VLYVGKGPGSCQRTESLLIAHSLPMHSLPAQVSDPKNSAMVEQSQSRIVRYVFNYNALEAISIVISTCILLVGMVRTMCLLL
jgi:hypothetical protein